MGACQGPEGYPYGMLRLVMNSNAALYEKLPLIETQVQADARAQRISLIGELLPNIDANKLDKTFYRQVIQPLIYSYIADDLEAYSDYVPLSDALLTKFYLRLNTEVTKQVLHGLQSLRSGMNLSDQLDLLAQGHFSESLQRIIDLYEATSTRWEIIAQGWVKNLSSEDLDIWLLALQGKDTSAIRNNLRLSATEEQVTQRITRLQQELLYTLIRALPQYQGK
jgi:hypothetical protein